MNLIIRIKVGRAQAVSKDRALTAPRHGQGTQSATVAARWPHGVCRSSRKPVSPPSDRHTTKKLCTTVGRMVSQHLAQPGRVKRPCHQQRRTRTLDPARAFGAKAAWSVIGRERPRVTVRPRVTRRQGRQHSAVMQRAVLAASRYGDGQAGSGSVVTRPRRET